MAKKKKTTLTKRKLLADVERVLNVQEDLVEKMQIIKKEVKEIGVLGFGAAKKKRRKKDAKPTAAM